MGPWDALGRPANAMRATQKMQAEFLCMPFILLMEEIWLTTRDVLSMVNNGINYLSTGAGFKPSTVVSLQPHLF